MPNPSSVSWQQLIEQMSNYTISGSEIRVSNTPRRTPQPVYFQSDEDVPVEDGEEMNVSEIFGLRPDNSTVQPHPLVNGSHRVGVEIELENITSRMGRSARYWRQIDDGSLRNNGAEFIFNAPYGGVDLFSAVVEIDSHLHALNPDANLRCSTHVHVDVRDMSVDQIKKMILAYMVLERILFRCSGWHRYKNNFCVALGFAESMIRVLSDNWNKPDNTFIRNSVSKWDKYTAINLIPMRDKGSIEFRISEPKWRKGQLLRLCNRFLALKEVAMSWKGTETELVLHLAGTHPSQILRKGFLSKIDVQPSDLDLGAKMAMDIINLGNIPRPRPVVSPECTPDRVCDGPDRFFETGRITRTWDAIAANVAGNDSLIELFGDVFNSSVPSRLTFSFLYQVECQFPINLSNWFADSDDREDYMEYRNWYRNQA